MAEIFKISPLWLIYGAESQEEETSAAPDVAMIISKDGMKYVDSPSCLYVQVKLDEMSPTLEVGDTAVVDRSVKAIDQTGIYWVKVSGESRERQKFCVHGIIGARQTGASNEHEHQTQFS